MSARSLLASITGKAQAALHGHGTPPPQPPAAGVQHQPPPGAPTQQQQHQQYAPPAPEQSGTLSGRHPAIEAISHQFRSLQAQYSSGVSQENRQLQLLVTGQKSICLDFDNTGRDAKAVSKELYLWGQTQPDDIKDVTDRLAYLAFVQGSLSYTVATEFDKSRQPWKNLRDAEAQLAPRRTIRGGFQQQITKFRADGGRTGGVDVKIQELEAQLKKAEADDAPLERELELLKRTAIKESETLKWKAIREYAHKLLLLADASEQLLKVLPSSPEPQYHGAQQTAAVRAALQKALDGPYVPSKEYLPLNVGHAPAAHEETRSFGETHAQELSTITSATDHGHDDHAAVTPINPATLNNTPAPVPTHTYHAPSLPPPSSYTAPIAPPPAVSVNPTLPAAPTVAEAGVPISSGTDGPGPISGSLANPEKSEGQAPTLGYGAGSGDAAPPIYAAPPSAKPPTTHLSAEEEKARLRAAEAAPPSQPTTLSNEHQGSLVASTSIRRPDTHNESAEDEKKRLEREERERVLRADTKDSTAAPEGPAPPAYTGP